MKQTPGNTHAKRALFELRQRIVNGELQGGTRLYEVAMAEKLQISRTPIREAMSRLTEEGLLDRSSGGGFIVRTFSFQDVIDAIELRGILEGTAARWAAERGADPDKLAKMKSTVKQMIECFTDHGATVDFDSYAEFNAIYHDQLASLCQSNILNRELERAKSLPFASPSAFLPDTLNIGAFTRSLFVAQEQHRTLLEAIEAREGARAEAIAREHARIALSNLMFVLDDRTDLISQFPSLAIVVG